MTGADRSQITATALASARQVDPDVQEPYVQSLVDDIISTLEAFSIIKGVPSPGQTVHGWVVPGAVSYPSALDMLRFAGALMRNVVIHTIPVDSIASGDLIERTANAAGMSTVVALVRADQMTKTRKDFIASILDETYRQTWSDVVDRIEAVLDAPLAGTPTAFEQVRQILADAFGAPRAQVGAVHIFTHVDRSAEILEEVPQEDASGTA